MPKAIENKGLSVFYLVKYSEGDRTRKGASVERKSGGLSSSNGPSRLNGEAKDGSCDKGADANPPADFPQL